MQSINRYFRLPLLQGVLWSAFFLLPSLVSQDIESLNTGRILVREFRDLGELGKDVLSLAWSADGRQLLVDKMVSGRFYGIFIIDLATQTMKSVSQGSNGIGSGINANNASPAWSGDGRYILFCGQESSSNKFNRTGPGYGLHSNLWITDMSNGGFHRLTMNGFSMSNPKGTVYPYFSPDGQKVIWTAILGQARSGSFMGRRGITMAELQRDRNGNIELGKSLDLTPGNQQDFYECYGFLPDGKKILMAANLSDRQPWFGMDLYFLDIDSREVQPLTETLGVWDRFAALSPKGEKIVWSSSMECTVPSLGSGGKLWEKYLSTELWMMNKDGSGKRQMTGFNQRNAKEYTKVRSVVGMSAWHPNGREIALVLLKEGRNYELESSVIIIELDDAFTPPLTPVKAPAEPAATTAEPAATTAEPAATTAEPAATTAEPAATTAEPAATTA
ncbi:MAG: hypothetical protein WCT05_12760, partial [Lentisphaeria bacterium]